MKRTSESIFGHFRANVFPTLFWTILPLYSLLTTKAWCQQGASASPRGSKNGKDRNSCCSNRLCGLLRIFSIKKNHSKRRIPRKGPFTSHFGPCQGQKWSKNRKFYFDLRRIRNAFARRLLAIGGSNSRSKHHKYLRIDFWSFWGHLFSDPFSDHFASILPIYDRPWRQQGTSATPRDSKNQKDSI